MKWPLPKTILGYWCSGYRCSDDAATLCAWVDVSTIEKAKAIIQKLWPEASQWRFAQVVMNDWKPGSRFPTKKTPTPTEGA